MLLAVHPNTPIANLGKPDLLAAFFASLRAIYDTDATHPSAREVAQPHADVAGNIIRDLRRRALDKGDTSALRDVHTLANELNGAIMDIAGRMKEHASSSPLIVPGRNA